MTLYRYLMKMDEFHEQPAIDPIAEGWSQMDRPMLRGCPRLAI